MRHLLLPVICFFFVSFVSAQENQRNMTLEECVEMATASSLQAFRAKNLYLSNYWAFRTYKAGRLPTISFQFSPLQYTNSITQRYDYIENIDVFRQETVLSTLITILRGKMLSMSVLRYRLSTGESGKDRLIWRKATCKLP